MLKNRVLSAMGKGCQVRALRDRNLKIINLSNKKPSELFREKIRA